MIERPPAIFAIGKNYADHAAEMREEKPVDLSNPVVFMKNPASMIGSGDAIVIPRICREPEEQVDFEGELAVILGRDCKNVPVEQALDYVEAYAIANDVSARWWQKKGSGGQWIRGKSFDTFCPMNEPVSAEEIKDPQNLAIKTTINGEIFQDGHTSLMTRSVAELIAELSYGTTLLAGSVILTGTPAGVGAARTPPRFLQDGDVVEISIEGLGMLRNPVECE